MSKLSKMHQKIKDAEKAKSNKKDSHKPEVSKASSSSKAKSVFEPLKGRYSPTDKQGSTEGKAQNPLSTADKGLQDSIKVVTEGFKSLSEAFKLLGGKNGRGAGGALTGLLAGRMTMGSKVQGNTKAQEAKIAHTKSTSNSSLSAIEEFEGRGYNLKESDEGLAEAKDLLSRTPTTDTNKLAHARAMVKDSQLFNDKVADIKVGAEAQDKLAGGIVTEGDRKGKALLFSEREDLVYQANRGADTKKELGFDITDKENDKKAKEKAKKEDKEAKEKAEASEKNTKALKDLGKSTLQSTMAMGKLGLSLTAAAMAKAGYAGGSSKAYGALTGLNGIQIAAIRKEVTNRGGDADAYMETVAQFQSDSDTIKAVDSNRISSLSQVSQYGEIQVKRALLSEHSNGAIKQSGGGLENVQEIDKYLKTLSNDAAREFARSTDTLNLLQMDKESTVSERIHTTTNSILEQITLSVNDSTVIAEAVSAIASSVPSIVSGIASMDRTLSPLAKALGSMFGEEVNKDINGNTIVSGRSTEGAIAASIAGGITGAAIGSVVPFVGTTIGAAVGAFAGYQLHDGTNNMVDRDKAAALVTDQRSYMVDDGSGKFIPSALASSQSSQSSQKIDTLTTALTNFIEESKGVKEVRVINTIEVNNKSPLAVPFINNNNVGRGL